MRGQAGSGSKAGGIRSAAAKLRKARVGRNPNRPEHDVPIPPRAVVKFKAGKEMKAQVMKLSQTIAADGATPPPAAPDTKPAAE